MRSSTVFVMLSVAAVYCGFLSCDKEKTPQSSNQETTEAAGSVDPADGDHEDAHATPPAEVSGAFLTCAFADVDSQKADKSNTIGCNVVTAAGTPLDIRAYTFSWLIHTPTLDILVTGKEITSDAWQFILGLDAKTLLEGTAILTLKFANGSSVTYNQKLADVTHVTGTTASVGAPNPEKVTFQGKWPDAVAGCAGDPACNVLIGPAYCKAGALRAQMALETGESLPGNVSAVIDQNEEVVDLTTACVELFRQSATEIAGNCYAVQLRINGRSALYIARADASPRSYHDFDELFSNRLCTN